MSGVGIIVGKKACCCNAGCNALDLRSWLQPAGKYEQLAITCGLSGNWYRNWVGTGSGCSVSWGATISGSDADRGTFLDARGYPMWNAPANQTIGSGSYAAMVGRITCSLSVVGSSTAFGAPQLDPSAPQCLSGPSGSVGYHLVIGAAFESTDPSESCGFPESGPGYSDQTGFSVLYVKRCCNYQDGPLGTYHRVGPQTFTLGPAFYPDTANPIYEYALTYTAGDTLTVTEEL